MDENIINSKILPGNYRHFKGNEYEVIGIARHSETEEELVVYKALYGSQGLWIRPLSMWNEIVDYNGDKVRRFTYIGDESIKTKDLAYSSEEDQYRKIYKIVKEYLAELVPSQIDINKYFINEDLPCKEINQILYVFLRSTQDYQFLPNVIGLMKPERSPIFKRVLLDYNYSKILDTYTVESLYEEFCINFNVKNKDSKGNSWRKYANSVISSCEYLAKFKTADAFNRYVESFNGSLEAAKKLQFSVKGMGLAIACNTLKDLGFVNYSKPDIHMIDVMNSAGLSSRDEEDVFNAIRKVAKANNDTPFNVDRSIWLICSGGYFMDDVKILGQKGELIRRLSKV